MTLPRVLGASLAMVSLAVACATPPSSLVLQPAVATAPVPNDPDDPALWVPADPGRTMILVTDKVALTGGLYAFGLDGKIRHSIVPLDRPNNVDVEYGFRMTGRAVDIAVLTERLQHRLRVYGIRPDGSGFFDAAPNGVPVLTGQSGESSEPMGLALYRRPGDGAVFAIVAPKTGGVADYLWQYRLEEDREGLAIYAKPDGAGFLVSSDQIAGGSRVMIYRREGEAGRPHDHPLVAVVATSSDETDGLEVTASALPGFPDGVLVMMNSTPKNFLIYGWSVLASRLAEGVADARH